MAPRTQKKSAAEEKLTAGGSGVSASSGIPSRGKGDQVSKPTGAENAVKAEVTGVLEFRRVPELRRRT